MLTLYFYMIGAFLLGFLCKHPGTATIVYCVYHFMLFRPLIGTGFVSEIEFDVFYTLIFVLNAIIGWMLAHFLGMPSVFHIEPAKYLHIRTNETSKEFVPRKQLRGKWVAVFAFRFAMGILMVCAFLAATLPFELIPMSLAWLGIVLSVICMLVAHVVFYFIWAWKTGRTKREVFADPCNAPFKVRAAPYFIGIDYTLDVMIYIGIYAVVVTLVFCPVFAYANWFWQFWTALILTGAAFIFYLIMGLVAMRISKIRSRKSAMSSQ